MRKVICGIEIAENYCGMMGKLRNFGIATSTT